MIQLIRSKFQLYTYQNSYSMLLIVLLLAFYRQAASQSYRTFYQHIETGSYALTNTNNSTHTITFSNNKTNSLYAKALSFARVEQDYLNSNPDKGRFSVILDLTTTSPSSMTFSFIQLTSSSQMQNLKVQYLVIKQSFSYLQIVSLVVNNTSSPISYDQTPVSTLLPSPVTLQSSDVLAPFISGYDYQPDDHLNRMLSFQIDCSYNSSTLIEVVLKKQSSTGNLIIKQYYLSVNVLIYQVELFKADYNNQQFYYNQVWINSDTDPSQTVSAFPIVLNNSFLFYGFDSFTKTTPSSTSSIDFRFNVTTRQVRIIFGNSRQLMHLQLFSFVTEPNCTRQTVWNASSNACQDCPDYTFLNNFTSSCQNCNLTYDSLCLLCNSSACLNCTQPYILDSAGNCTLICSLQCINCTLNPLNLSEVICSNCSRGYYPSGSIDCQSICGDGEMISGQSCDDGNSQDGDGCSSACMVEPHFNCTNLINSSSSCFLQSLDLNTIGMVKSSSSNQFTLAFSLAPASISIYAEADWLAGLSFDNFSLTPLQATYDFSTNRLVITFAYSQNLHGRNLFLTVNYLQMSSKFALVSMDQIQLPQKAQNNLVMMYFSDITYSIGQAVNYLSLLVSGLALVLFLVGYFGAKLIALECIALVQISGLLLVTLEDMGPTYDGLQYLSFSLGATRLTNKDIYFQYQDIPNNFHPIFTSRDSFSLFNISLIATIVVPLTTAVILKILSTTKYQGNYLIEKAWKYTCGTFTYYGILFLAYGELSSLALNLRYPQASVKAAIGITVGILFTALLILYVVHSSKYPRWFGSFKQKFCKFTFLQYFYTFSSLQRLLTSFLSICLSPGQIAPSALACIFTFQALLILLKQPYILNKWIRPLVNKILAVVVCLLYLAASLIDRGSLISQSIPLIILLVLMVAIGYSTVAAVYSVAEHYRNIKQRLQGGRDKKVAPLNVEQGHKLLMQSFERRLMPSSICIQSMRGKPVENEEIEVKRWRWQKYTQLYSLDHHSQIIKKLNKMGNNKGQDQQLKEINDNTKQKELSDIEE